MAVMHLLVSGYSEGKIHEPYFYTDKQATIIHSFINQEWDEIPFFPA